FLFRAALGGGGQALGVRSGLLRGAPLDLIELDGRDPTYAAATDDALLDAWIFAGGRIDRVWRRGRLLVEAGRHVQRSAAEQRFRAALEHIFS
ncbi:MAG: formimidoylglutamate deiminase, partial [Caulobacteraceae bacterium]